MKKLFVIRNQNDHYLAKNGGWVDGSHRSAVFRTEHKDVALNELFETNIRDFDLRGEIMTVDMDDKRLPVVEVLNPIEVSLVDATDDMADSLDVDEASDELVHDNPPIDEDHSLNSQ